MSNPSDYMQSLLAQQSLSYSENLRHGGASTGLLDGEGKPIANCYLSNGFATGEDGNIIGGNHFLSNGFSVISSKVDAMLEGLQQDSFFEQNPISKFFDGVVSIGNINAFGSLKYLSFMGSVKISHLSIGEKLASISAIHNPTAAQGQSH